MLCSSSARGCCEVGGLKAFELYNWLKKKSKSEMVVG